MSGDLVVIGDALLDRDIDGSVDRIAPDAPVPVVDQRKEEARPGGAGLAALLGARDGFATTLVTAVGNDEAGNIVVKLLIDEGIEVINLGTSSPTPEKVRVRARGRALIRLDRGGTEPGDIGRMGDDVPSVIARAAGVLVSDYGRGMTGVADITASVMRAAREKPVVWDPHPRGAIPIRGAHLVTPNLSEAAAFTASTTGGGLKAAEERARTLMDAWSVSGVAVTLGSRGALFVDGGTHPLMVPAPYAESSDTCGAGDRFAVSVTGALAHGLLPREAVTRAVVESSRFVATGGAGAVRIHGSDASLGPDEVSDAVDLAGKVKASGGTVVATGGCFDLIHPGHVALLESARRLGDCLIVCLNSDESVRTLKGPSRPVNKYTDRRAVLNGLWSVDAVEAVHSATPHDMLSLIKPDIWVKGGDYESTELPEASLIESWGGEVVILPYIRGHSTTGILNRAGR